MRTISSGLKTAIENGKIARLLKITRKDGVILGLTDHDVTITVDGQEYEPSPGLASVKLVTTKDTQVSNQEIGAALIVAPHEDLIAGVYDEAEVEAAWCSWEDVSLGRVVIFKGSLGEIRWDERGFVADVVSVTKKLERNIGWTYTSSCRHELFGTAETGKLGYCGVDASTFTFTGAITEVTVNKWKFTIDVSQADGYFSNGVINFTSGGNAAFPGRTIKKQTGNVIELFTPSAMSLNVGDTFTIKAGCDKSAETCKTKFDNLNNFGGFPHIQQDVSFR